MDSRRLMACIIKDYPHLKMSVTHRNRKRNSLIYCFTISRKRKRNDKMNHQIKIYEEVSKTTVSFNIQSKIGSPGYSQLRKWVEFVSDENEFIKFVTKCLMFFDHHQDINQFWNELNLWNMDHTTEIHAVPIAPLDADDKYIIINGYLCHGNVTAVKVVGIIEFDERGICKNIQSGEPWFNVRIRLHSYQLMDCAYRDRTLVILNKTKGITKLPTQEEAPQHVMLKRDIDFIEECVKRWINDASN